MKVKYAGLFIPRRQDHAIDALDKCPGSEVGHTSDQHLTEFRTGKDTRKALFSSPVLTPKVLTPKSAEERTHDMAKFGATTVEYR